MTKTTLHGIQKPTITDIKKGGFSTPWDAPMIPPFPFEFRDMEILTVFYRSNPAVLDFILPEPMRRVGDIVAIHIYKMNDTSYLGPYRECNVMFGAKMDDVSGGYSPYLALSSDVGVAHGREIHGQPKKLGNPDIEFRGDLIVGTVERNGIDVVTVTTPYKQNRVDPEEMKGFFDFSENLNLKAIDHIDGRPAIRQITARKLQDVVIHECWQGPATVELRANAQLPIHRLEVVEPITAFYWRADFTLVEGRIVYDYLEEK